MDDKLKLLGITSGFLLFTMIYWLHQRRNPKPPKGPWKKVGNLSQIMFYPVKSLGCIKTESIECSKLGSKLGKIHDRSFVVVNLERKFVTARQQPKMILISPSLDQENDDALVLNAPGMETIRLELNKIKKKKGMKVTVWGEQVQGIDCGDEIAKWLSKFLAEKDEAFRLFLYPLNKPSRAVRGNNKFPLMNEEDVGIYPDCTSYMMINQSSVDDLNTRLRDPITCLQLRPNFVVEGAESYAEDNWDWIKIGNTIYRNIRPCSRCVFTTINPETGIKNPKNEPLKTLRQYRQLEGKYRSLVGESPILGIHLGLKESPGFISIGDPIFVAQNPTPIEKIM